LFLLLLGDSKLREHFFILLLIFVVLIVQMGDVFEGLGYLERHVRIDVVHMSLCVLKPKLDEVLHVLLAHIVL
jgi:hypothetical protein